MAITDFDSLSAEIKAWCARNDTTFSSRMEMFVAFAEDRIYLGAGRDRNDPVYSEPLRVSEMEATAAVAVTSTGLGYGQGNMPSSDSVGIRKIYRDGDQTGVTYCEPQFFSERAAQMQMAGSPVYYTFEFNTLKVAPSYTGTINVTYWKRFNAVSINNKTSALLTAYPLAYFNACMYEAFSFTQAPDLAMAYLARYRAQVAGANKTALSSRYAGRLQSRPRQVIG